jgi:hypothetical protein
MISFDTNVLVYATAAVADDRVSRAQDLLARAMRATTSILLLLLSSAMSPSAGRAYRPTASKQRLKLTTPFPACSAHWAGGGFFLS